MVELIDIAGTIYDYSDTEPSYWHFGRSLKNYITDYNNLIEFDNHKLDASYINNKFSIKGQGTYSINNKKDNISYNVEFKNGDYFINSQIDLVAPMTLVGRTALSVDMRTKFSIFISRAAWATL